MIDTPNENPKLNFDQLQAIDVAQKRITVLESEAVNATKVLRGIKMEIERAVKELAYQEELLATKTSQVEDGKKQVDYLTLELAQLNVNLSKINSEINTKTIEHDKKIVEFKEREEKISTKENELVIKENTLAKKQHKLDTDLLNFNTKVAKLKEVIKDF